jgi:hypothetical protein
MPDRRNPKKVVTFNETIREGTKRFTIPVRIKKRGE